MKLFSIFASQLRQQQQQQQQQQQTNQSQGMVRTQMLTTVKGNIVQQIPLQQGAQAQVQQQSQQQQQPPQPTIMQTAQGQQLVNATILTNANGGQPVTVWQRRTEQGIFSFSEPFL